MQVLIASIDFKEVIKLPTPRISGSESKWIKHHTNMSSSVIASATAFFDLINASGFFSYNALTISKGNQNFVKHNHNIEFYETPLGFPKTAKKVGKDFSQDFWRIYY